MQSVEFFLFKDADSLDISGPLEVFTIANELFKIRGQPGQGYQVCFSGADKSPVKLGSGMSVNIDRRITDTTPVDNFIVPGGLGVDDICSNDQLIEQIASKAGKATRVISVCTGAFILARCGALDDKSCTTHWIKADELKQLYPQLNVVTDSIYVQDGHTFTSAGITAGIDLALAIVEQDHGPSLAIEISRMMVLYFRRPGGQSQFSAPIELKEKAGDTFSLLHDWMQENIQASLNIEELAAQTNMSPRHFSRTFKAKTGYTPAKYVELMRLSKARELLESTQRSIDIIAHHCGFQREERMRRVFIRFLGVTPTQYRLHFNAG